MNQNNRQKGNRLTDSKNMKFISIREQKQLTRSLKTIEKAKVQHSGKQIHAHQPLSRQERRVEEKKRVGMPLYHPSRFR